MASNTDIEMRWIDAWNKLYEIVAGRQRCLLPDGSIADIEQCKGWIHESVYQGYVVHLKNAWVGLSERHYGFAIAA